MNEGLSPPPRLCRICGELELVEYRIKYYPNGDRAQKVIRAVPVKALKEYEKTLPPRHWQLPAHQRMGFGDREPKNRGWGLFLNRIDPNFTGPYCCGDCIFTYRDKCIAIHRGKPTTDEFLLGGLREG